MKNINISIEKLYKALEQYEGHFNGKEVLHIKKAKIKIQNERLQWKDCPALIVKKDSLIKFKFDNYDITVGSDHKFIVNNSEEKFAKNIDIKNDVFNNAFYGKIKAKEKIILGTDEKKVYDLQINSEKKLYITKEGLVHHNTSIFAGILKAYSKSRILCLFDQVDLINQTREELLGPLGFKPSEIGMIQGVNFEDDKRITLLSIQSYEKAQHLFPKITVVVADEVHSTGRNPTSEKIIYSCQNAAVKIGLTATTEIDNPYERLKMFSIIGPIVYRSTIKEKIDENYLAKMQVNIYETNSNNKIPICGSWADIYEKRKITAKYTEDMAKADGFEIVGSERNKLARRFIDYGDESNLYVINEERNKLIASIAKTKKRCLILFDKIKQGQELKKLLPEAYLVTGSSSVKERQKAKELLRDNENQIVLASTIFAKGVNIPSIACYINASAGKGTCKLIQKLGRATRLDEATNKTSAEVIDFYDSYNPIAIKQSSKRYRIYSDMLEFDVQIIRFS